MHTTNNTIYSGMSSFGVDGFKAPLASNEKGTWRCEYRNFLVYIYYVTNAPESFSVGVTRGLKGKGSPEGGRTRKREEERTRVR